MHHLAFTAAWPSFPAWKSFCNLLGSNCVLSIFEQPWNMPHGHSIYCICNGALYTYQRKEQSRKEQSNAFVLLATTLNKFRQCRLLVVDKRINVTWKSINKCHTYCRLLLVVGKRINVPRKSINKHTYIGRIGNAGLSEPNLIRALRFCGCKFEILP